MFGSFWLRKENERLLLGGGAMLFTLLVLLPFLGTYGLWDPHEIAIADAAQRVAKSTTSFSALWAKQPPLGVWLVGKSVEIFGPSELTARLPLALLALVGAAT